MSALFMHWRCSKAKCCTQGNSNALSDVMPPLLLAAALPRQVFDGRGNGGGAPLGTANVPKIGGFFSVAPGAAPHRVAAFVPEHKGKPARVTLFQVTRSGGAAAALAATASRSSFQAQEISFRW
jgi:hypothetical protein